MSDWPFEDPPNVATFTVRAVMDRREPILLVCRDAEDGTFQFLTGGPIAMSDALFVALRRVVDLDASVMDLADLPLGWEASRATPDAPWVRTASVDEADDAGDAPLH